jgi:hypothetical protein
MKIDSDGYIKRMLFVVFLAPFLFVLVSVCLLWAAAEHGVIRDQIGGVLLMNIMAVIVFSNIFLILSNSARDVELVGDCIYFRSPKYGEVHLYGRDIESIEGSSFFSLIKHVKIHDVNGRMHRIVLDPMNNWTSRVGSRDVLKALLKWRLESMESGVDLKRKQVKLPDK